MNKTGWYKYKDEENIMYVVDGTVKYGFNAAGQWVTQKEKLEHLPDKDKITTCKDEEVYTILYTYTERDKGITPGTKVKCLADDTVETVSNSEASIFDSEIKYGEFWLISQSGFVQVLNDRGEWAKPINN
jgi:hypothetical protein